MTDWNEPNLIWNAYKAEPSLCKQLEALELILQDVGGLIACQMLKNSDSCLERRIVVDKIPV